MHKLAIIASVDFQNLLLNNKERSIGGTSSVINNILNYLDFESIILLGITNNKNDLFSEILISKKITFIPIIYIPTNSFFPSRFHVFFKSRIINKYLNKYKPDVVYSHCIEMSFWLDNNYFIVEHMHGAVNAIKRSKYPYLRVPLLINVWEYIRKKTLMKAKQIIAIDESCLELAIKNNHEKNIHLIRNFVDTDVYYRDNSISESLIAYQKRKIILFVGRIEEVKGLELFVDTIAELRKNDSDWTGVIVGKGSYESTIKNYIKNKQMQDSIVFTGAIYNQQELRKIYNQSRILLLTSYHEGIPMAILESLACGTPVLSTDVGGISNLSSNGIHCFTIKERNAKVFSEKIIEILALPEMNLDNFPYSSKVMSKQINKILKNNEN